MSSEKFCLRWNDFETNISTAFRELRDDKDFFDVTLACNGDQIQAHKVILSACSPFFRNILRRNPHQHPLLYLKGVKYTDLQSVLNFMYHGEVNVAQEELNSFLAVAEELSVKGLTQNQPRQSSSASNDSYAAPKPQIIKPPVSTSTEREPPPPPKRPRPTPPAPSNHHAVDDDIQEVVPVKSEPREPTQPMPIIPQTQTMFSPQQQPSHTIAHTDDDQALAYPDESYEDYGQYDDQDYQGAMDGMSAMSNHPVNTGAEGTEGFTLQDPSDLLQYVVKDVNTSLLPDLRPKYVCSICLKFSHQGKTNVRNHVESKHFPGQFVYNCDKCGMTFPSKSGVQLHRSRIHKEKESQ